MSCNLSLTSVLLFSRNNILSCNGQCIIIIVWHEESYMLIHEYVLFYMESWDETQTFDNANFKRQGEG